MPRFVKVAEVGELQFGDRKVVEIDGQLILLFNVDGEYYAISATCSHQDQPLTEGLLDGYILECPWHGAKFDIRTGAARSLPAVAPVPSYEVKVETNDILVAVS